MLLDSSLACRSIVFLKLMYRHGCTAIFLTTTKKEVLRRREDTGSLGFHTHSGVVALREWGLLWGHDPLINVGWGNSKCM